MLDTTATETVQAFLFGPFSLSPKQRLLLVNGKRVRLGCRTTEMLIVLVERAGEVIGKAELIARVWPKTVVIEGNLTAQMTALRRALNDGRDGNRYILNEHGRGYRFIAPVIPVQVPEFAEPVQYVSATGDRGLPSLKHLVELCCGFVDPSQQEALPQQEDAAVDAILRRGILALEFARTLVSDSGQPAPTRSEPFPHSGVAREAIIDRLRRPEFSPDARVS